MFKKCLFLLIILLGLALPATAQVKPGALTITPMVGGHLFEGNLSMKTSTLLGIAVGYNFTEKFSLEGVYTNTDGKAKNGSLANDTTVETYRLDGLFHFREQKKLVPYFALGFGGMFWEDKPVKSNDNFMMNYGAGLKYFFADSLMALRADVRHLIESGNPGNPYNHLQFTTGLTVQFGGKTSTPTIVSTPAVEPSVVDSDGDGIPDHLDKCPGTPRGVAVDAQGCPIDSDGDGVPDYLDKCPGTPTGVRVDAQGCPLDSDGDGVADHLDKCPGTPRGVTVDAQGCPIDSDGDGVPDYLDKCPGTPAGVRVDAEGCPTVLSLRFNFGFDSANVSAQFDSELIKAATCINSYPGHEVVIIGHTDSVGPAAYNQDLSERRAAAVKNALIERFNVPAAKMVTRGMGEEKPVADNNTEEGQAMNRRVDVACGYDIK